MTEDVETYVIRSRREQGLPPKCTDPVVLGELVRVLGLDQLGESSGGPPPRSAMAERSAAERE